MIKALECKKFNIFLINENIYITLLTSLLQNIELDGFMKMTNNKNYDICFNFLINEKIIIYLLALNGLIVIISFILMFILSYSIMPSICSIIIFVTLDVMINYFILTRSKLLLNNKINLINSKFIDEIEEYQTIMK